MPTYLFRCSSCDQHKEVICSISERDKKEVICSQCKEQMKRTLTAPVLMGFDNLGRSK